MKFDYERYELEPECVAYVDERGDLCIKTGEGLAYIMQDGNSFSYYEADFNEYMKDNGAKKKFYPGDKITITF